METDCSRAARESSALICRIIASEKCILPARSAHLPEIGTEPQFKVKTAAPPPVLIRTLSFGGNVK
jgi:hypothetical protein